MAFKSAPGLFRTLRHIAEQKNTRFAEAPNYDPAAGVPAGAPGAAAGSTYKDTAEQAKPSHPTGARTVFSLKGS